MSLVPPETQRELVHFCLELNRRQLSSGSWESKEPTLQSIVVSCQAVQYVVGFRGKLAGDMNSAALSWLNSPRLCAAEFSYWRAMPLIVCGCPKGEIDDAVSHVAVNVASIRHHSNSPLKPFYLDCLSRLEKDNDEDARSIINEYCALIQQDNPSVMPVHMSYAITVLSRAACDEITEELLHDKLGWIKGKGIKNGISIHWESLVSTSYVVINLLELRAVLTDSSLRAKIETLIRGAASWLVTQWTERQFDGEPLAGGDFRGTLYNKIVVARALSETADWDDPRWREEWWVEQSACEKGTRITWMVMAIGLALFSVGVVPMSVLARSPGGFTGLWAVLSVVASIVGICTAITPGVRFLYKKYSRASLEAR